MRTFLNRSATALFALSLAAILMPAHAAPVTLFGDDVKFTFDDAAAFGGGLVIGNSLFFLPTTFKVESLDGGAGSTDSIETLNVTLNVTVERTTAGYVMEDFALSEQGDYELNGAGASVQANGQFRVTSATKFCGGPFFPCMDESIFDAGPLTVTGALTTWSAGTTIDLDNTAGWGDDTKVIMTLENRLNATTLNSGVGETAFIEKKFEGVGITVNPVPVPAAVWLFGSALGLLGWMRRR